MKACIIEGASTAYGSGSTTNGGWAALLHRDSLVQNELYAPDIQIVTNMAVPGITLSGINKRLKHYRSLCEARAGYTVVRAISVGQNEARIMPTGQALVSEHAFTTHLQEFVEVTAELGAKALFVGPQHGRAPSLLETGWYTDNARISHYGEAIREAAHACGSPYVDVIGIFSNHNPEQVLATDGRHPTDFGHKLIHTAVASALYHIDPITEI